jgi:hypothetical protein
MTRSFNITGTVAAAAAGVLALSAQAAAAGTLLAGYAQQNGEFGVTAHNGANLAQTADHAGAQKPVGLAYGAGSYYVAGVGSPSNNITRYDMTGAFMDDLQFGPLLETGPMAFGANKLFMAYESELSFSFGIGSYDPDLGFGDSFNVDLPEMATGLAFGDDSLFVSYGTHLAQYDLNGGLLHSFDFGIPQVGALAYGDGMLYAAYSSGSSFGWGGFDPAVLFATGASSGPSVATPFAINGLAFGDGGLFASFDGELVKYDLDGNITAVLDTGRHVNGPLAFVGDGGGAVPEPSAWLLMILGFGTAGAVLRRRMPSVAA